MTSPRDHRLIQGVTVVTLATALILVALVGQQSGAAQRRRQRQASDVQTTPVAKGDSVERAIGGVCQARRSDVKGTVPIDDMARTVPVPLTDTRVIAAQSHAQGLLASAKRLVPFAVRRVSINNGVEPLNLKWMITRVQAVKNIRLDVAERDNSAWRPSEPDTIRFGTVFLLGLRSDEAMIAVLAHELTHAINGTDEGLQPLFTRVGAKANHGGRRVGFNATMELTCELVGLEVARDYITQTKAQGIGSRQRLARALQKDCVSTDMGDENHLSPRDTMRTLLNLQPGLVAALPTETSGTSVKKRNSKLTKAGSGRRKKR